MRIGAENVRSEADLRIDRLQGLTHFALPSYSPIQRIMFDGVEGPRGGLFFLSWESGGFGVCRVIFDRIPIAPGVGGILTQFTLSLRLCRPASGTESENR